MDKTYIYITGDYNDGDYVNELNEIKDQDELNELINIVKLVRDHDSIIDGADYLTEDQEELLNDYLPATPDWETPIHTLGEFKIINVSNEVEY
jgi:hypothetical protein